MMVRELLRGDQEAKKEIMNNAHLVASSCMPKESLPRRP